MTRRTAPLWCTVVLSLIVLSCAPPSVQHWQVLPSEPRVRIALLVRVPEAQLQLNADHEWLQQGHPPALLQPGSMRLAAVDDSIMVSLADGREFRAAAGFELHPRVREARFELGEDSYRGSLRVVLDDGQLTLINILPLEMYLSGVVPWEIGWRQEKERSAVEAQAIAARTYACKRLGQYEEHGYDLLPNVQDQIYRGTTREDSTADHAILETRGVVLTSGSILIEAYYSSTCGGHTARIEEVWDKPPEAYLVGGLDRPSDRGGAFCSASRHFRWTEAWSGAELQEILEATLPRELQWPAGRSLGRVVDLRCVGRDSSGRVRTLEVETAEGTWKVEGDRIRWVLSPIGRTILRSILFEMAVERDDGAIVRVVIRGGGNGHGVGMCQMGAIDMARRGYDRQQILRHYYPQTVLSRFY